jgi:sensor histidine kinase YesM
MKGYFIHNAVFRIVAPAVYGVLIYLLILLINNNVAQVNVIFVSQEVYVFIALTYLSFESIRMMIVLINRFAKGNSPAARHTFQVVITTVISVVIVIVCLSYYFNNFVGFSMSSTQQWIFSIVFVVTALLYNILYFSNYFLQKENSLKLNAERQQRQVLELEMMEFKNDLNPDLLYESLENLIGIMYRDVEKAEDYIDCLASTYRYVLANRQQELVPVREELAAARNIIKLLNQKFNGQLKFESAIDDDVLESMLIPGSLPLVIESLIRNTIIAAQEIFVIRCYIEDDYLTLQSKLNDKLMLHEASAHAITRLQRSYSLYSDLPLIKVKAYDENYIKLPLVSVTDEINR